MEEDFQEIGHSGGKIELKKQPGNSLILTVSGANPWAFSMFHLKITFDGVIIGNSNHLRGYAPEAPPEESDTVQAMVISDRNGLWGRTCPYCKGYFRTNFPGDPTYCPYCYYEGKGIVFLTKNQLQFVKAYFNAYMNTLVNGVDAIIDLDELTNRLDENKKSPWVYSEEKQQTQINCSNCKIIYDILGEYGRCPKCAMYNATEIINEKFNNVQIDFDEKNTNIPKIDRKKRETEWKSILSNCVSIFDGLGNEFRGLLLDMPYTPKRRTDLSNLSFQNIKKVNDCLNNWFGFEIFSGLTDSDKDFLNKMFNKRHILIHKNGIVDAEYLANTGDATVKIGQLVRLDSDEIKRLIPLVNLVSMNYIKGFESII